jgi:hypothetical protein
LRYFAQALTRAAARRSFAGLLRRLRITGFGCVSGRNFPDLELKEPRRVILINEAVACLHFPNEDPIGKRLDVAMFEKPTPAEIIGVVGNVRYDSLIDEFTCGRLFSACGSALLIHDSRGSHR